MPLKRLIVLSVLNVALLVTISAGPASALPPSPIHGVQVATTARALPPSPIMGPFHGQNVSLVARPTSTGPGCNPVGEFCPSP